jgi:hypothetical protein
MPLTSALLLSFALAAPADRVLLCRPAVTGDAALARADALVEAARPLGGDYLDYGVSCESVGEAARAAQRAGLGHGVFSTARGDAEGAGWELVLTTRGEEEVARRRLVVAPGSDPVAPLREALRDLGRQVPRPPPRWTATAGWVLLGVGVAALGTGAVLASQARDEARRARSAATPAEYAAARDAWKGRRTGGAVALSIGGAALSTGLLLELAF